MKKRLRTGALIVLLVFFAAGIGHAGSVFSEARKKPEQNSAMTSFENYDQKANQLFNILSSVLRSMKDMEGRTARRLK